MQEAPIIAYFNRGHTDGYFHYESSAAVLGREFGKLASELACQFPRGSRLLEVGSGYRYFLKEARPHFYVSGIEISEAAVAACRLAGLAEVRCATLQSAGSFDQLFDVAVMLDVIEQLFCASSTARRRPCPFHSRLFLSVGPANGKAVATDDSTATSVVLDAQSHRRHCHPMWSFAQ